MEIRTFENHNGTANRFGNYQICEQVQRIEEASGDRLKVLSRSISGIRYLIDGWKKQEWIFPAEFASYPVISLTAGEADGQTEIHLIARGRC